MGNMVTALLAGIGMALLVGGILAFFGANHHNGDVVIAEDVQNPTRRGITGQVAAVARDCAIAITE
jgi:hypothetical protein